MPTGSFTDFLNALRNFESGLDVAKLSEYKEQYGKPNTVPYFEVTDGLPGHVKRDKNGNFVKASYSYAEYFKVLGVDGDFPLSTATRDTIEHMQYRSINFLGFVGYQVGELALTATGYYILERQTIDGTEYSRAYHGDAPNSLFPFPVGVGIFTPSGTTVPVIATSANYWTGKFTGKNGVTSLEALRTKDAQEHVVRDVLGYNLAIFIEQYAAKAAGNTLAKALGKVWTYESSNDTPTTMSGLLAATWLVGPWGLADMFHTGQVPHDETGTSAVQYLNAFGGYETIYAGAPGRQFLRGTVYNEDLHPLPDYQVYVGDGAHKIYVNPADTGSPITIHGFTIGQDYIVLPGTRDEFGIGRDVAGKVTGLTVRALPGDENQTAQLVTPHGGVTVILEGHTAAEVTERLNEVVKVSYTSEFDWSSTALALAGGPNGFDPKWDILRGHHSIGFSNITMYLGKDGKTTYVQQYGARLHSVDGGFELPKVTPDQLSRDNFVNFDGAFEEILRIKGTL